MWDVGAYIFLFDIEEKYKSISVRNKLQFV